MDSDKIILDSKAFKALAVESRVKILKLLRDRRYTQSDLAKELKMSIPAVKEHLDAMAAAGLVQRNEEGRRWIYYSLAEKGRYLLEPDRRKLMIMLALFIFSAAASVITFLRSATIGFMQAAPRMQMPQEAFVGEKMAQAAAERIAENVTVAAQKLAETQEVARAATAAQPAMGIWLLVFLIAAIVFLILTVYYFARWRKKRL